MSDTDTKHELITDQAGREGETWSRGPYVYSLVFGMTVSDVSGKAIANLAPPCGRRPPTHQRSD